MSQSTKSRTIRANKKAGMGLKASMLESTQTHPNDVPFPTQSELRSSDACLENGTSEMQCSEFETRSGAAGGVDRRLVVSMLKNSEIVSQQDMSVKDVKFHEGVLS